MTMKLCSVCKTPGGSWFDRTVCPEPCATMHDRCTNCGTALDGCPLDARAGVSALSVLTDKLKRVRDLHRQTCIVARCEVSPTAFTCGMCELLDEDVPALADQPPAHTRPHPTGTATWPASPNPSPTSSSTRSKPAPT